LIRSGVNRGFSAAVNQGLSVARGDVLVLLNNDTLVSSGWIQALCSHLADPRIGLVGPVTNCSANEAQIDVPYQTYGGFAEFAAARATQHAGQYTAIPMLTMFCVALRRDTYQCVGPLDERFGVGTFEDDDYSRRARQAGYAIVCAEDVFVHHFGQASFGELVPGGAYAALLDTNRRRFEEKWHVQWAPHRHRLSDQYQSLMDRIRTTVDASVPCGATVLVSSRGDAALLDLGPQRRGWHFPRLANGTYAGFYPADSSAAIEHLEDLRAVGAGYLLFPRTSLWWLDHYTGLRDYLDTHYLNIVKDASVCWIYELRGRERV